MAITTPLGLVFIGAIVAVRGHPLPGTGAILWAVLAGVLGAIGVSALYHGLSVGQMGVVSPIAASAPIVPIVIGLIRGDRPTSVQTAGIVCALVGMVLASRERETESGRSRIATGALFGLIAAGCFGFSLYAIGQSASSDAYWGPLIMRVASAVLVVAVVLAIRAPVRAPLRYRPAFVVICGLDVAGTVLFAVATTKGLISIVAAVISFVPVFIALQARAFLHERLAPSQLAGAGIAVAGIALISAGG
jgi:drug/metabolite transporter (DMT)-like permease